MELTCRATPARPNPFRSPRSVVQIGEPAGSNVYGSFVAIGDSFTEGLDDPAELGGGYRGWADWVAERLAEGDPGFRYANLAVRGKLLGEIVAEQLPGVQALGPELVSIAGGGNDILRRSCDADALASQMRDTIRSLAATGAHVLAFAGFDPTRLAPLRSLAERATILNAACRATTTEVGGTLVDLWQLPVLSDPRMWSVDRIHLSTEGHRQVASAVLAALGMEKDGSRPAPLPPAPAASWVSSRAADASWGWRYLRPWLVRRLRGQSSGDAVFAKRPELTPWVLSGRESASPRG